MPFPSFRQAKFKRLQKPRFVRLYGTSKYTHAYLVHI